MEKTIKNSKAFRMFLKKGIEGSKIFRDIKKLLPPKYESDDDLSIAIILILANRKMNGCAVHGSFNIYDTKSRGRVWDDNRHWSWDKENVNIAIKKMRKSTIDLWMSEIQSVKN